MDLVEQASWWWNKDIATPAAYGATLSNVMRPGISVVEILPTGYEPKMFRHLMADAAPVHGYRILSNTTQKGKKGFKNRDILLEPKVDKIVCVVCEALEQHQNDAKSTRR